MSALAPVMEGFFTGRLLGPAPTPSPSYRDTFRLLLGFAQRRTGKTPSKLAPRGALRRGDRSLR